MLSSPELSRRNVFISVQCDRSEFRSDLRVKQGEGDSREILVKKEDLLTQMAGLDINNIR